MLHTVISPYDVFKGCDSREIKTKKSHGAFIAYQDTPMGRRIERLISTDPNDYLKKELEPGRRF